MFDPDGFRLDGAVALVTGAAKRIGRAIASDLAARGWGVAVHHRSSADAAAEVVAEIRRAGGRAVAVRADLSDEAETAALVASVAEALGPPTCLINNASVFERDDAETATSQSWNLHMQVNSRAPFILTQELYRHLPPESRGHVINIVDQRVWNLTPFFTSYTVSKAALWTLTRTLAMALAPNVRVNAVGPGPVLPSPRQSDEQFAKQWSKIPMARPVDPQEICAAIRFLLDAPSVTGQMIAVDLTEGKLYHDGEVKDLLAAQHPYTEWTRHITVIDDLIKDGTAEAEAPVMLKEQLRQRQMTVGMSMEDLEIILTKVDSVPYLWGPILLRAEVWQ